MGATIERETRHELLARLLTLAEASYRLAQGDFDRATLREVNAKAVALAHAAGFLDGIQAAIRAVD